MIVKNYFMMPAQLLTIFVSSFVIALSGAMMPGPLLTVTINESSRRAFIAGPLLIAGHAVLELALVIALLLGLAPVFSMPLVFSATAIGGAIILLWMAFNMFRTLPTLTLSWEGGKVSGTHPIASGILMSVANPYWFIWWGTIGLGYIMYSMQFGLWGVAFFFAGHISADLIWYSIISFAVAGGRHFLTDRVYRAVIAACAAFLVLFAFFFAVAGFRKLGSF